MLGQREMVMADYVDILRRRWLWIAVPALLGPVIGYGVSKLLPEQYTSQTLVLVEAPKVPDRLVPPVMVDELSQLLGTMKEQILSRTRLQPIIETNSLFAEDAKKVPMEDLVARMRKAVNVATVAAAGGSRGPGVPGFTISFTYSDARTAQLVCQQITSLFIEENLKRRGQLVQSTADFLGNQLQEAKRKLDEQDAKLADFKRRYIGQMPGKEDMNLQLLMSSNAQLEATTQALQRAQQDKAYAETILAQQLAAAQITPDGASPQTLERQMSILQSELVQLEGRYTPDHPDVVKKKAEISQLQKRLDEQNRAAKAAPERKPESASVVEPPQVQALRNQIRMLDQLIREKSREQDRLQQAIRTFQSRVQLSPQIEQEYKELTRDYETAQGFYNELLGKKTAAEMSIDLEKQQQGEQFRVMDAANLPASPSFPNRLMFAGGGLSGGLGLGLCIVLLLEMKDKAMRCEMDVEQFLELPALALVPSVGVEQDGRGFWKRRGKAAQEARA
jgi:polysaccharide chain length determinant protein (PEP-CTERM system associated)